MVAFNEPSATLSILHRADGSATFSQNGYSVIGAVNGPIEILRRDELPEEAAVDVIVRPAAGVGGTRERHLESILQSTLRQIILIQNFPRTLIQVTLQITGSPENETIGSKLVQAGSNLPLLPALFQASVLALLSASLPLSVTMTSVLLALDGTGASRTIVQNPTPLELQNAASVHVLGFASTGELLVAESEGNFGLDDWEAVVEHGTLLCCGEVETADEKMQEEGLEEQVSMMEFVKSALHEKVAADLEWKS